MCRKSLCSSCSVALWGSAYLTQSIPYGTPCCLEPYGLRQCSDHAATRHLHPFINRITHTAAVATQGPTRQHGNTRQHKAGAGLKAAHLINICSFTDQIQWVILVRVEQDPPTPPLAPAASYSNNQRNKSIPWGSNNTRKADPTLL